MVSRFVWLGMLLPAVALVAVLVFALGAVLVLSVFDSHGGISFALYAKFLNDSFYTSVLLRSVWIAVYVTAICLLLGYPIAIVIARGPKSIATFATLALAIQFFSIYVVKMYGWMLVLGNNGIVNRALIGTGIVSAPLPLMYNEFGVAVGLVGAALPLLVFPVNAVIQNINPKFEEAALGLGASRLRALMLITIPLSLPGVVSGMILTFVFCFTAYLTPALLGGGYFKMIGNVIYEQATGRFNYPLAATAATITLMISLIIILGMNRIASAVRSPS